MSADILRRAAETLRKRAGAATAGPWRWFEEHGRDFTDEGWSFVAVTTSANVDVAATAYPGGPEGSDNPQADAAYIATMSPPVGLALADWLDSHAASHVVHDPRALAVARAVLGGDA